MSWFEKLVPTSIRTEASTKSTVPEGLWSKCTSCSAILYNSELEKNFNVCPKCDHHMRVSARRRIDMFLDKDNREEIGNQLKPVDPLKFKDSKRYKDRLTQAQKQTKESDALVVMAGSLKGQGIVAAAFDFSFMGGSMGSVVGERFVRGVEKSLKLGVPFIVFTASGGARMQESLFSLFQMAKTSAALTRLSANSLPFIAYLTDPTMGGVSASLAMLGDLNIAEPKALIGFAGPRVIEQTVREKLPEGFQRSEFLQDHGAIDMIVDRRDMCNKVASVLAIMMANRPASAACVKTVVSSASEAKAETSTTESDDSE